MSALCKNKIRIAAVVGPTASGKTALSIELARELGGEIITVGSDAHDTNRLGQHIDGALAIAKEVFGRVYTFENRRPIVHKL